MKALLSSSFRSLCLLLVAALPVAIFSSRAQAVEVFTPPAFHHMDTNRNNRISLSELTRLIELYNTRYGTTRTGCYRVDAQGEDGFAPEPERPGSTVVALERYYSADSNRDGKLGLFELTRGVELYNYRVGTARTGEYHAQDLTEDGFAPGPAGTGSIWHDVTGDGILDEIIGASDPRLQLALEVQDSGWEVEITGAWSLGATNLNSLEYTGFSWNLETLVVPIQDDPWATMSWVFAPAPGEQYIVWADDEFAYNNQIHLWPPATINARRRWSTADLTPGSSVLSVPSQLSFLSFEAKKTWYLIRVGPESDPERIILPTNSFVSLFNSNTDTLSEPEITDVNKDVAITAIIARLEQLMGRSLSPNERSELTKKGCVALARIMMRQPHSKRPDQPSYPPTYRPEMADPSVWPIKAFVHYADAIRTSCPGDRSEVVFAIEGRWTNDTPPVPNSESGEVPITSLTDGYNYRVRMPAPNHGKWMGMSHGLDDEANSTRPQMGWVYDGPPLEHFPEKPLLFVKVCVRY